MGQHGKSVEEREGERQLHLGTLSCSGIEEWDYSAQPRHLDDVTACQTKSWPRALYPPTLQHTTQVLYNTSMVWNIYWDHNSYQRVTSGRNLNVE